MCGVHGEEKDFESCVECVCQVFYDAFLGDFCYYFCELEEHVSTPPINVLKTSVLYRNLDDHFFFIYWEKSQTPRIYELVEVAGLQKLQEHVIRLSSTAMIPWRRLIADIISLLFGGVVPNRVLR